MTVQSEPTNKEKAVALLVQRELAKRDFIYFLDFVFINEPANLLEGTPGGKIPIEKWPHIIEMAESLMTEKQLAILKARQVGFSWIVCAYATWLFAFYPSLIICLSRGEPEARSLVRKIRFVYMNLPAEWMLPVLVTDGREELAIPWDDGVFSRVMAFASTQDAARGETANLVIQDEAEFHQWISDNLAAVQPTIDMGGQIVMGSTSNKRNAVSVFKSIYNQSPGNGWKKHFYSWKNRPGRDEKWYERTKRSVPEADLAGLSPDQFMEQEYPRTEEEALAPSRARAYFNPDYVEYLEQFVSEPLREVAGKEEDYRDIRNFYIARTPKGRYTAGTDVSYGIGQDFSVTVVLDLTSMHVVADIMSNAIKPDEWAEESMELLKFYRNPIWGIEQNGPGQSCIDAAKFARYPKLFHTDVSTRKGGKKSLLKEAGWVTSTHSRPRMWFQLQTEVNAGAIFIHNREGLMQLRGIIRLPDGEPDHRSGAHDDYPTALGIANSREMRNRTTMLEDDSILGNQPPKVVNLRNNF